MPENAWRYKYNVTKVPRGEHIWFDYGRLAVVTPIDDDYLLLRWDLVKRDALMRRLGFNPRARPVHWEYTDEDWDGEEGDVGDGTRRVRPVPVHIQ